VPAKQIRDVARPKLNQKLHSFNQ